MGFFGKKKEEEIEDGLKQQEEVSKKLTKLKEKQETVAEEVVDLYIIRQV